MKPLLLFLLPLLGCVGYQNTDQQLHISPTGNDDDSGRQDQPFRTIQKGIDVARAGDSIFVHGGVYAERLVFAHPGTSAAPIHLKNYGDDLVTLDGSAIDFGPWGGLVHISGQVHISISGIGITHSTFAGFFVEASQHIAITNCKTDDTFSSGIGIWQSEDILVEDNEVARACNDGGDESISIAESAFVVVHNNNVHDNGPGTIGGEGIDVKDGSHDVEVSGNHVHNLNKRIGIYVDAWDKTTHSIRVFNNLVHDIDESGIAAATEMGGLLEDVSIYNNVVYGSRYGGIEVGAWTADEAVTSTPIRGVVIINNTLFDNFDGINLDNADAKAIVVRNNLFSDNRSDAFIIGATREQEITRDHNLLADPATLFVDAAAGDFHLQSGAAAIDAGNNALAPESDFDGTARRGTPDLGAYEYRP